MVEPTETGPDIRARVVALEKEQQDTRLRLSELERWRTARDIDSARHDERWTHMDEKIDTLSGKIDRIGGHLEKMMWVVIVGILGAFVAFIIKGGLHLG